MKKILLLVLVGLWAGWISSAWAQQAKTCFVNMPDSVCPLFTAVNRADFIDFLESKMKAEVTNRLGGKSEMTELSSDYLSIQTSPQSTWQMKLLPVNDSTQVICTVSTVCAPVCDSHVRFYTADWMDLSSADFLPSVSLKISDFLRPASDTTDIYLYEQACREADLLMVKASLHAQDRTLTFRFTTPEYMEKEAAERVRPFVRESIQWEWKQGKFCWK